MAGHNIILHVCPKLPPGRLVLNAAQLPAARQYVMTSGCRFVDLPAYCEAKPGNRKYRILREDDMWEVFCTYVESPATFVTRKDIGQK